MTVTEQGGLSLLFEVGGGSGGVSSLNTLTGDITLAAGSNITITPSGGDTLTIAASGSVSSAFDAITSGTNTSAAMVVGTGGSLATSGSGSIVSTAGVVANEATDTTCFFNFTTAATGNLALKSNANATFNSNTGAAGFSSVAATAFTGALTGNASTATALQNARTIGGVSFDGTANIVPQTIESANEATDTTCFPLFITASGTQSLQPKNNTALTFNSNTVNLACTTFTGALVGNASTATNVAVGGITGLGTGVATWLATPSSSNLAAAVTGETGTGALVFGTAPTFASNITVGTASSATGAILLKGTTSGTVTLSTADAAGTWTMKLPTTAGTNLYFLQTDGSGNTTWAAGGGGSSPLTTKGDIYTYTSVDARLPVGTNGQVLSADSGETTGLKWIANTPTAAGSDTNVQFNNSGSTDGDDSFTFNKNATNPELRLTNSDPDGSAAFTAYNDTGTYGLFHVRGSNNGDDLMIASTGKIGIYGDDQGITLYCTNASGDINLYSGTGTGHAILDGTTGQFQIDRDIASYGTDGQFVISDRSTPAKQLVLGITSSSQAFIDAYSNVAGPTASSLYLQRNGGNSYFGGAIAILESGSSPQYYSIFTGGDQTGDINYTLPIAAPASNGLALCSTTGGVMSWTTAASSAAGDEGAIQFDNGSHVLTGAAGLFWTPGSNRLAVGHANNAGSDVTIDVYEATDAGIKFETSATSTGATAGTFFGIDGSTIDALIWQHQTGGDIKFKINATVVGRFDGGDDSFYSDYNIIATGGFYGAALGITGALADGTYPCGTLGSITIANGVITAIS